MRGLVAQQACKVGADGVGEEVRRAESKIAGCDLDSVPVLREQVHFGHLGVIGAAEDAERLAQIAFLRGIGRRGRGEVDDGILRGQTAVGPFDAANAPFPGACGNEGVEGFGAADPAAPGLEVAGGAACGIGFAHPAVIAVIAHPQCDVADPGEKRLIEKDAAILHAEWIEAAFVGFFRPLRQKVHARPRLVSGRQ